MPTDAVFNLSAARIEIKRLAQHCGLVAGPRRRGPIWPWKTRGQTELLVYSEKRCLLGQRGANWGQTKVPSGPGRPGWDTTQVYPAPGMNDPLQEKASTCSQHFQILREAGLIRCERKGVELSSRLRLRELEARFPGLLRSILRSYRHEKARGTG